MEKQKKIGLNAFLLLLGLVPIVVGVIISATMSYSSLKNALIEATESKISAVAENAAGYYGVDWTAWMERGIEAGDEAFIDGCKAEDVEMTIFREEGGQVVRYLSSIRDDSGNRVKGTTTTDEITAACYGKGETVHSDGVMINGKPYYVCYKPIKEGGKIVGMSFAGEPDAKIQKELKSLLTKTVIVSVIVILAFVIIIVVLARMVVGTFKAITDATVRLSEGYINDDIDAQSPLKEFAELIVAAKKLQENLQMIVGNIRQTSGNLSTSVSDTNGLCTSSAEGSSQITTAVAELATASQSMAEAVQDLNENMLEIGNSINTIEDSVKALSASSEVMDEVSNEAKENITAVYESSEKSVNAVNNIASHMDELARAIREVSDATKLISDISSQTNLLSLNASIEAARAGEAGKGFAVVASEISSLANQSDEGVKKIDDVIKRVLDLSNLSMQLTEDIKVTISDEQLKVQSTQDSFMKLKSEIDASIEQIGNIAKDATILAEAKDSAIGSVSDLSAISEENAASTEEVTASIENLSSNITDISVRSDDMASMSETLIGAVSAFKEE
ncbi:MAG: methyl-accepting chemotaxis protein [Lachnospiraceae bacterium]|nr:methyl-accepting chemotaxis protein [Lachnospiraceae bacterium]